MEKHTRLLQLLLEQTAANKLEWRTTSDEDTFVVSFSASSVMVSERYNPGTTGEPDYIITLVNSDGNSVEEFSDVTLKSESGVNWFGEMKMLFKQAKRAALGADKVLDNVISELEKRKR